MIARQGPSAICNRGSVCVPWASAIQEIAALAMMVHVPRQVWASAGLAPKPVSPLVNGGIVWVRSSRLPKSAIAKTTTVTAPLTKAVLLAPKVVVQGAHAAAPNALICLHQKSIVVHAIPNAAMEMSAAMENASLSIASNTVGNATTNVEQARVVAMEVAPATHTTTNTVGDAGKSAAPTNNVHPTSVLHVSKTKRFAQSSQKNDVPISRPHVFIAVHATNFAPLPVCAPVAFAAGVIFPVNAKKGKSADKNGNAYQSQKIEPPKAHLHIPKPSKTNRAIIT